MKRIEKIEALYLFLFRINVLESDIFGIGSVFVAFSCFTLIKIDPPPSNFLQFKVTLLNSRFSFNLPLNGNSELFVALLI